MAEVVAVSTPIAVLLVMLVALGLWQERREMVRIGREARVLWQSRRYVGWYPAVGSPAWWVQVEEDFDRLDAKD